VDDPQEYDIVGDMMVVIDTNVLVAGLMSSREASNQILKYIGLDAFEFAISVPLLLEYEDVLSRPYFLRRTGLSIKDIDQVLNMLAMKGYEAPFHFMWRPQLRDPNDEMVLETATNGGATAIVTFNQRDFLPAAADFAIKIITPGAFLKQIDRSLP
jgi:putative PIN family toxin of toxin-antitoxin system